MKLVKNTIDSTKYRSLKHKKDRVSYLRALAIGVLINEAVDIFLENEAAIFKGEFDKGLLDKCKYEAQINRIMQICSYVASLSDGYAIRLYEKVSGKITY